MRWPCCEKSRLKSSSAARPSYSLTLALVERGALGRAVVRADDRRVAAGGARADVALLEHGDVADAVVLREVVRGREAVRAAADDRRRRSAASARRAGATCGGRGRGPSREPRLRGRATTSTTEWPYSCGKKMRNSPSRVDHERLHAGELARGRERREVEVGEAAHQRRRPRPRCPASAPLRSTTKPGSEARSSAHRSGAPTTSARVGVSCSTSTSGPRSPTAGAAHLELAEQREVADPVGAGERARERRGRARLEAVAGARRTGREEGERAHDRSRSPSGSKNGRSRTRAGSSCPFTRISKRASSAARSGGSQARPTVFPSCRAAARARDAARSAGRRARPGSPRRAARRSPSRSRRAARAARARCTCSSAHLPTKSSLSSLDEPRHVRVERRSTRSRCPGRRSRAASRAGGSAAPRARTASRRASTQRVPEVLAVRAREVQLVAELADEADPQDQARHAGDVRLARVEVRERLGRDVGVGQRARAARARAGPRRSRPRARR